MKIKCDYCGNFINDTDPVCPYCNGVNSHLIRSGNGVPKTISELLAWCNQMNIPLEQARFFIGQDYRGPRAFGIYYDERTGYFVVYKNKSDGSRAIRYEGRDEAYAVNEIYQKLKEEILNQKRHSQQATGPYRQAPPRNSIFGLKWFFIIFFGIIIMTFLISFINCIGKPHRGYYTYGNQSYYYQPGDGWFLFSNGDWNSVYADDSLQDNFNDYYNSSSYDDGYNSSDFSDSYYYNDNSGDSDSGGWDSDWNSGWNSGNSWDSGFSNWNSNW